MKALTNPPVVRGAFATVLHTVLHGARGSHLNDFRRRRARLSGLLMGLGMPAIPRAMTWALTAGQLLTVAVILFGLVWIPARSGLRQFGLPVDAPTLAAGVGVLLAVGLLQARRRYSSNHASWAGVSPPIEVGMRGGAASMDIGLAAMFTVQNLRWHETTNLLAAGALVLSAVAVVLPGRGLTARLWVIAGLALIVLYVILIGAGQLGAADLSRGTSRVGQVGATAGAAVLAGVGSVMAYRWCAPKTSLRSRGLFVDLGLRAAMLFVLPVVVMSMVDLTPWDEATPYVGVAVFFLLLLFLRAAMARVLSPEGLGYGLFLLRLAPAAIRPMVLHSLVLSVVVPLAPLSLLAIALVIRSATVVAVLLVALVVLESCLEAFIIQRSTAVLPTRTIAALAQKSKAGLAAALCAAVAMTFSGLLGATGPQIVGTTSQLVVAGALTFVAVVVAGLTLHDAPAWIRDLTATETEEP